MGIKARAVKDKEKAVKDSLARLGIKRISVLTGLLMFATVPLPGFSGNPTGVQLFHTHSARWPIFNRDSADNNTSMIAVLDKKLESRLEYEALKRERRDHERDLYILLDDNDNFRSELKRKIWERRDMEINEDIKDIKKELKGQETLLDSGMMFASRDR